MDLLRLADLPAQPLSRYGSHGVHVAPLAVIGTLAHGVVARFDAGGVLGAHVAPAAQLFTVVAGAGWVMGPDGEPRAVVAGDAAWWGAGEAHAAGSEEGMVALLLESPAMARA